MDDQEGQSVPVGELAGYRLWNLVRKARFFDRESRDVELGAAEQASAWEAFCERHKLDSATALPIPADYAGCTPVQLREAVLRDLRVATWKEREFGSLVEEYFERQKSRMEKVVYSLLRLRDAGVARELWFRIAEGEETFSALAMLHGAGMEKLTGGIIGPVAFGAMHPALAGHLMSAREGELLKPFTIGEWHLVARLEKRIPALLDAQLRAAILDDLAAKRMEEHAKRDGI